MSWLYFSRLSCKYFCLIDLFHGDAYLITKPKLLYSRVYSTSFNNSIAFQHANAVPELNPCN